MNALTGKITSAAATARRTTLAIAIAIAIATATATAIAIAIAANGLEGQRPSSAVDDGEVKVTAAMAAVARQPGAPTVERDAPVDWGAVIDELAGSPDDPNLPHDVLGASDEVLASTDPARLARLLQAAEAVEFARASKDPRYLFAMGRAAEVAGYARLSESLLLEASQKGSAAATGLLGLQLLKRDDLAGAKKYLDKAVAGGFRPDVVLVAIGKMGETPEEDYTLDKFQRKDIIGALERGDVAGLDRMTTLTYLMGLHRTLWEGGDLLFMTSPKILLELDPFVEAQINYQFSGSAEVVAKNMRMNIEQGSQALLTLFGELQKGSLDNILQTLANGSAGISREGAKYTVQLARVKLQGEMDARRLAIGYEANRDRFRKIYSGVRMYLGAAQ